MGLAIQLVGAQQQVAAFRFHFGQAHLVQAGLELGAFGFQQGRAQLGHAGDHATARFGSDAAHLAFKGVIRFVVIERLAGQVGLLAQI